MPAIGDIRDAIAAAVNTIENLRAFALTQEQIAPPAAVVFRKMFTYDDTMDDATTFKFGVRIYVSRTNERVAQELLDEFAAPTGDTSIKAVVESDTDLAALCSWVVVTDVSEIQIATVGVVDYLSEDFTIEVAAP